MTRVNIFSKEKDTSIIDGKLVTDPNKKYIGHFDIFLNNVSKEYRVQESILMQDHPRSKDYFYEIDGDLDDNTVRSIIKQTIVNLNYKSENGDHKKRKIADNMIAVIETVFS